VCASLLESERLVDRIDVELPESEVAHGFEEIFDPEAPYGHNYHDKVLAYLESGELRVLRDEAVGSTTRRRGWLVESRRTRTWR